jgi:putative DNA primase/helicase
LPNESDGADRATELANAEEFHRLYSHRVRYNVDSGKWLTNGKTHWQEDRDGEAVRLSMNVAREAGDRVAAGLSEKEAAKWRNACESVKSINATLTLAKAMPGISKTADEFDADDFLLNCPNGTLELGKTIKLRRHEPNDLITKCLAVPYDPRAVCPLWERVVARSMNNNPELIAYLQRACGVALTGTAGVHELLIFHGVGANGKSVIIDTIIGLLGPYAGIAPESLLTASTHGNQHPTEIADLQGKRLIVASETESGATMRLQLVKRLTGDATLKGRFMRQDFFEFRRTFKLWLQTNNKPRLSEDSEAVWRRLRLLPFAVVIPEAERDPNLIEKLKAEHAGILAWCVRGCLDWQNGGMRPPPEVLAATSDYRADADELAEFVSSRCIVGVADTFRATRADLFAAYTAWAKATNERRPMERGVFYEAIRRRDGISDADWKSAGVKVRGFKGIAVCGNGGDGGN